MDKFIKSLLEKTANDSRLLPSHMGMIFGILQTGIQQPGENEFIISRKKLMQFTKIKASSTYHRCLNQLIEFGYFSYFPSYDPRGASVLIF